MGDGQPGFDVQPDVLTAHEATGVLAALDDVRGRSRAGARHLMSHPVVAVLASDTRLLTLAKRILGEDAKPYRATLFDKSPGSNWLVVWHQDTALPLRFRREVPGWGPWSVKSGVLYAHAPAAALEQVVALRIHLDDSLPENGPLRVLPGTHSLGVLSDPAIQNLATNIRPRAVHGFSGRRHLDATAVGACVIQIGKRITTEGTAHRVRGAVSFRVGA